MKKFCEFLREPTMDIIIFKKKKMKLLTKEQQESFEKAIFGYIYKKKKFEDKYAKNKKIS